MGKTAFIVTSILVLLDLLHGKTQCVHPCVTRERSRWSLDFHFFCKMSGLSRQRHFFDVHRANKLFTLHSNIASSSILSLTHWLWISFTLSSLIHFTNLLVPQVYVAWRGCYGLNCSKFFYKFRFWLKYRDVDFISFNTSKCWKEYFNVYNYWLDNEVRWVNTVFKIYPKDHLSNNILSVRVWRHLMIHLKRHIFSNE